ncbi:hypothetical protein BRADI_4g12657v3 [Brachypodium distachyon]|uniref:Uncharacterized protein n=1 Tax=Brachypodium distachyon TaxID=15368 RepID=A0A0Q3IMY8_BRADI|nr:hypothetical protein BRADI_4g12657v3 [Brachypodium distachyon]
MGTPGQSTHPTQNAHVKPTTLNFHDSLPCLLRSRRPPQKYGCLRHRRRHPSSPTVLPHPPGPPRRRRPPSQPPVSRRSPTCLKKDAAARRRKSYRLWPRRRLPSPPADLPDPPEASPMSCPSCS